jgi:hypothetical protein
VPLPDSWWSRTTLAALSRRMQRVFSYLNRSTTSACSSFPRQPSRTMARCCCSLGEAAAGCDDGSTSSSNGRAGGISGKRGIGDELCNGRAAPLPRSSAGCG